MYNGNPGRVWDWPRQCPCMFSMETLENVLDTADGKRSVFSYPELEVHGDDFIKLMDDRIDPLAGYRQNRNGLIHVRTKHTI